jgi:hypothetical protein
MADRPADRGDPAMEASSRGDPDPSDLGNDPFCFVVHGMTSRQPQAVPLR